MVRIGNNYDYLNTMAQKNAPIGQASGMSFSQALQKASATKSMDDIFDQASAAYGVPVSLLKAIGKAESNFDSKAVSGSGAQGVMQLMPRTAQSLGVKDPFDAEQNIMGGAKYISQMLERYDGNTKLALAAYNAGSGNVAKYGGIPPFKETQEYVTKVMAYAGQEINATGSVSTSKAPSLSGGVDAEMTSQLEILKQILNFDAFTQDDYNMYAAYLKEGLQFRMEP